MSQNICEILSEPVLEEKYTTDVSRETALYFESKGISICELEKWQSKYPILYPWDEYYNSYRLGFNRAGQFFPRMIVMSKRRRDAKWALAISIKLEIEFSIRSGAHDPTSFCLSNGIIIDLSKRDYIKVCDDIIKIGVGVRIGPLVEKLAETEMVLPTGTCQNVGIAGLSMGAGIGFLERKYGLTLDSMLSATILLANGDIIKVDDKCYPDMFWAIRGGGGGSLGIVTDFEFKVYKLSSVLLFELWCPFKNFIEVFGTWQKWAPFQVDNLASNLNLYPLSAVKSGSKKEAILVGGQFEGSKIDLKVLLSVFRGLCTSCKIWRSTVVDAAIYHATPNPPLFFSYLNLFSPICLSTNALRNLAKMMLSAPDGASIEINSLGGFVSGISSNETAFMWRKSLFWMLIKGPTDNQRLLQQSANWVRKTYDGLLDDGLRNKKTGVGMLYCNFKDVDLSPEQYPLAYWGKNSERLSKVKGKYDPCDIFNYAQSIPLPS